MATKGGPNIVNDGLVLYLDAGNSKSYSGTGTTWSDLSGNGNDGTLSNGPIFNSNNSGIIQFDGGNDTTIVNNVPINTNSLEGNTVEQFLKWNGSDNEMPFSWFDIPLDIWIRYGGIGINNGSSLLYGTSNQGLSNKWIHLVIFFPNNWSSRSGDAKMWINGEEKEMTVFNGTFTNRTIPNPVRVSIGSGYNNNNSYNFGGSIANTRIYNKELSDDEVIQNYNAQRSRFES